MAVQKVPGLDGGYGWLVSFACFAVNFIMQGVSRAAGVLYVEIIELYGVSREEATTPFSLRYGVRNMMGPIAGIFARHFGMRAVVIAGGILASIGGVLCAIAPDIFWISMLFGVVHGIGYGLCSTVHLLILNQYFDKYKATSIAIALTGDCFGTFVFPSLLEFLLLSYGVDGTFLILGAICLNIIPAGMIMRAPDWLERRNERQLADLSDCYISQELNNCCNLEVENKAFEANEIPVLNILLKENQSSTYYRSKNNTFSDLNNRSESSLSENKTDNYFINIRNNCDSDNFLERNRLHEEKIRQNTCIANDTTNSNSQNSCNYGPKPITEQEDSLTDKLPSVPSSMPESKHYALIDETATTKQRKLLGEESSSKSSVAPDVSNCRDALNETQITTVQKDLNDEISIPPVICESNGCKIYGDEKSASKQNESLLNKVNLIPSAVKYKSDVQLKEDKFSTVQKEEILFNQSMVDTKPNSESTEQMDETSSSHKQKDSLFDETNNIPPALVYESENCELFVAKQSTIKRKDSPFDEVILKPPMTESKYNQMLKTATVTTVKTKQKELPFDKTPSEMPSFVPIDNVTHNNAHVNVSSKGIVNSVKRFLNLNIRPLVVLMGMNLASYSLILIAVLTIIVDYAADKGILADHSKYLIISFSVADLFGRIGFGVILDKKLIKLPHYSGANIAVMGISVLAIPFSSNYWYMMSCMFLFGSMQGGNAIVYPLLVEEYVNKGEETVALGCLCLYGGLIMLPMAPMIGYLCDSVGNYDGVFYTTGGLCLISGISWALEPFLFNVHQRMSRKALK